MANKVKKKEKYIKSKKSCKKNYKIMNNNLEILKSLSV